MKFNVDITARRAGALGVNSEKRVYKALEFERGAEACEAATKMAYDEGLENVVIVRMTGYGANGSSLVMPAQPRHTKPKGAW